MKVSSIKSIWSVKSLGLAAATIGCLAIAPGEAHAYELNNSLSCNLSDVTGASACSGSYTLGGGENDVTDGGADNIVTTLLNDESLFGTKDEVWTFGAKYDGGWSGNNEEGLGVNGLGSSSGTFDFSNIDFETTDVAVSLKAAKGFSVYYIEAGTVSDASEIQWSTIGTSTNRKGKAQGLSHLSYFTRIAELPEVSSGIKKVPEPTAISALLFVGAAAALRRKKKQDAEV